MLTVNRAIHYKGKSYNINKSDNIRSIKAKNVTQLSFSELPKNLTSIELEGSTIFDFNKPSIQNLIIRRCEFDTSFFDPPEEKVITHHYFPNNFITFPVLLHLELSWADIETLPANLPALQKLILNNNRFKEIPNTLLHCPRLEHFEISNNQISTIEPRTFSHCPNMRVFHCANNEIKTINLGLLSSILLLNCANNKIESFSGGSPHLLYLHADNNKITSFRPDIPNIKHIKLANNLIDRFNFDAQHLVWLDLRGNPLQQEPIKNTARTYKFFEYSQKGGSGTQAVNISEPPTQPVPSLQDKIRYFLSRTDSHYAIREFIDNKKHDHPIFSHLMIAKEHSNESYRYVESNDTVIFSVLSRFSLEELKKVPDFPENLKQHNWNIDEHYLTTNFSINRSNPEDQFFVQQFDSLRFVRVFSDGSRENLFSILFVYSDDPSITMTLSNNIITIKQTEQVTLFKSDPKTNLIHDSLLKKNNITSSRNILVVKDKPQIVVWEEEYKQELLRQMFDDPFYQGNLKLTQLYLRLSENYIGITKESLWTFLRKQLEYNLKHTLPKYVINKPIIVKRTDERWVMDTMFLKKGQNSSIPILSVIDYLSKYVWVRPLKNMEAQGVRKALISIFQENASCFGEPGQQFKYPHIIQSDNGSEFSINYMPYVDQEDQFFEEGEQKEDDGVEETKDSGVDDYQVLADESSQNDEEGDEEPDEDTPNNRKRLPLYVHSTTYKPSTNGIIENFQRHLRKKIQNHLDKNPDCRNIKPYLQEFAAQWNDTIHGVTKCKPRVLKSIRDDNSPVIREVHNRIKNIARKLVAKNRTRELEIGDKVYVSLKSISSKYRRKIKEDPLLKSPLIKWYPQQFIVKTKSHNDEGLRKDEYFLMYEDPDGKLNYQGKTYSYLFTEHGNGPQHFFATDLLKIPDGKPDLPKGDSIISDSYSKSTNTDTGIVVSQLLTLKKISVPSKATQKKQIESIQDIPDNFTEKHLEPLIQKQKKIDKLIEEKSELNNRIPTWKINWKKHNENLKKSFKIS
jgi:hypothetical protein